MLRQEEQLEFDIGEGVEPKTVSLGENGEAEVLEKQEPPAVLTEEDSNKEEVRAYGSEVQKRIDKLTARLREAERRENAALEYARSVNAQKETLEQQFRAADGARLNEAKGRIETQMLALKQVIRKAREENDIDTETEAQQRLAALIYDSSRVADAQARAPQAQAPVVEAKPAQQAPAPRQQVEVDPRAEEWAENNPWFGKDVVMTSAVRGIHIDLVQNQGFDPRTDEYYDEINRRMQGMFPDRLGKPASAQQPTRSSRPVQTVASANRATGVASARRLVKLSPSQVAIAKKLGVPLEEYAKYVKE
jgi:hypothetical protein